ncbi:MAG TPA: hypothetical protein VFV63_17815 [Ilumatobacteraceae bacterium]|nr:hypothetical protein [Ilumatobacteraceae bacterium]
MTEPPEARVEWLTIGGDAQQWRALGLTVGADGLVPFLFTSLRIVDGEPGVRGWALSGIAPAIREIDGLPTTAVDASPPAIAQHANGAVELDHVVVLTGSLERTCGAIADATGAPLKRVRELGDTRQGFHRIGRGGVIVEVVERGELGDDAASFWGVVINVSDLDAAVSLAGPELMGEVRDAVQPGRRIATVRSEAGLGLPVAMMSLPGRP